MDVLLVDDDPVMHMIVENMLSHLTDERCAVVSVMEWSKAREHANTRQFDLILLDNQLSKSITAQITVPMLRKSRFRSPIAIISSDIRLDYLSHPSVLGVDYIVDKANLTTFLKSQVRLLSALQ